MSSIERRHAKNFKLRQQINMLGQQAAQLQHLMAEVQSRTLDAAREGGITELPNSSLKDSLSNLFDLQKTTISQMELQTLGNPRPLITEAELAALFKSASDF